MGFEEFIDGEVPETKARNQYSTYPYDEREELVWEWIDELQDKFPEEVRCELVEIAPCDVKYNAKAYYKENGDQYMRVSESTFDKPTGIARSVVLHEMIHLYMFQSGWKHKREHSPMFKYLCGRLGAVHSASFSTSSEEWWFLQKFIEQSLTTHHDTDEEELMEEIDEK